MPGADAGWWLDVVLWRRPVVSGAVLGGGVALYVLVVVFGHSITSLLAKGFVTTMLLAGACQFSRRRSAAVMPLATWDWRPDVHVTAAAAADSITASLVWWHAIVTWAEWRRSLTVLAFLYLFWYLGNTVPLSAMALCGWVSGFLLPFLWRDSGELQAQAVFISPPPKAAAYDDASPPWVAAAKAVEATASPPPLPMPTPTPSREASRSASAPVSEIPPPPSEPTPPASDADVASADNWEFQAPHSTPVRQQQQQQPAAPVPVIVASPSAPRYQYHPSTTSVRSAPIAAAAMAASPVAVNAVASTPVEADSSAPATALPRPVQSESFERTVRQTPLSPVRPIRTPQREVPAATPPHAGSIVPPPPPTPLRAMDPMAAVEDHESVDGVPQRAPPSAPAGPVDMGIPAQDLSASDIIDAILAEHGLSPPRVRGRDADVDADAATTSAPLTERTPTQHTRTDEASVAAASSVAPRDPLSATYIIETLCGSGRLLGAAGGARALRSEASAGEPPADSTMSSMYATAVGVSAATPLEAHLAAVRAPVPVTAAERPPPPSTEAATPRDSAPAPATTAAGAANTSSPSCPVTGVQYREGQLRGMLSPVTAARGVLFMDVVTVRIGATPWHQAILELTLDALRLYIPPNATLAHHSCAGLLNVTRDVLADGSHVEVGLGFADPSETVAVQLPVDAGDTFVGIVDLIFRNTQSA